MKTGGSDSGLNLTHERFSSLRVRIAPYPEQLRIVAKLEELLSEIDAGVAELKAAQRKLARYRQSLLKAAVEGALTAEWRRQHTPSESGAQLLERILAERRARWEAKQLAKLKEQGKTPPKDWQQKYPEPVKPDTTNLSELPEGWVWASVDQLSVVVRGASPRPAGDPRFFGGDIPWITVGSLTADDSMYLTSVEQFVTAEGKEASRFIEAGTLLLTNSGATLGVPKITNIGGCINDGSVALLDVNAPLQAYLYWFLRTQTEKLRATNQGAAQPNLNTDIVKRICVPLCPAREMDLINDHLNAHTLVIQELRLSIMRALKQATAQRQNILRAAFAGELVPQDPNDEPACVLLERIRAERAAAAAAARPNTPRAPRSRRTKA
ncbi:restriction endonuclease subunit S [Gemmatimonas sp.]|uniref:restriction endonuclease subunit S n=1 Tax=Gemmatimonas sp. TaxID=1962908 RepID=UPI003F6F25DE